MEYRIINSTEDFDKLKEAWERLENTTPQITYYSTYRYARTKWEVYRDYDKYKLWMIVVEHNNDIVGIAPLMLVHEANRFIKWRSLQLLAVGDYGDFLVDSHSEVKLSNIYKEIFKAIEDNSELWDEINIHHVAHQSSLALFLLSSKDNKCCQPLIENPYVALPCNGEYVNRNSFSYPKNINNYVNRLRKHTGYKFSIEHPTELDEFADVHKKERDYYLSRGLRKHTQFEDPLWRGLMNQLSLSHEITAFCLRDSGNNLFVYKLGFLYEGVVYGFNTGFAPDYSKFRVGQVIIYESIQHAAQDHLWLVYDLGCGRYQWKFEWATGFNLLYRFYKLNPESKNLRKWRKLQDIKKAISR